MSSDAPKSYDIVLEVSARTGPNMRCGVKVHSPGMGKTYEMATDEGPIHGGDNSAPPPLAFFATGLFSCLTTQIRAFSKRMKIPINDVSIDGTCHWRATMAERGSYQGEAIGFKLDIDIDSDAPLDDIKRLIEAAKKGCFVEQTVGNVSDIGHRLKVGGEWIDI